MEYQAFVSLSPWTIIIQAANLMILTAIFSKVLFRPVQNILKRRQTEVENIYIDANERADKAEKMRAEYQERLRNVSRETEKIKKQAESEIERMKADVLDRAKGEAAHIRETAKRQTDQERKKAAEQLRSEASDMAVEIAEKILQREINRDDQLKLIKEFMDHAEFG